MVYKDSCKKCAGNRVVDVRTSEGKTKQITCPDCGGRGFKIRVTK